MYCEHYGFRTKPFQLTPDPEFLFLSKAHKRALNYLRYAIRDRVGFVVITGEVGAGKTTLARKLLSELDAKTNLAYLIHTQLDSSELIAMIAQEFGLQIGNLGKVQLLAELQDYLSEQHAKGLHSVLLVDEAQCFSFELLEEIRMLSNFETGKSKLLQIILLGQPQLRAKLNHPDMEQLRQRVTVTYHIPPLSREECEAYIQHRLDLAVPPEPVCFWPEAVEEIYRYSGGIPRLINLVCDATLLCGYVDERRSFDGPYLAEVIAELRQEGLQGIGEGNVSVKLTGETEDLESRLKTLERRMQELSVHEHLTASLREGFLAALETVSAQWKEQLNHWEALIRRETELHVWEKNLRMRELRLGLYASDGDEPNTHGNAGDPHAEEVAMKQGVWLNGETRSRDLDQKLMQMNQLIQHLTEAIADYQSRLAELRQEPASVGQQGALP